MTRYFFDIDDGQRHTPDDDGTEMADRAQLRKEAIRALADVTRDELPNSDQRVFSIKVRDGDDRQVFYATLTLVAEWMDNGSRPA